jgi:hypothetical protein
MQGLSPENRVLLHNICDGDRDAWKTLEERIASGSVSGNDLVFLVCAANHPRDQLRAWKAGVSCGLFDRGHLGDIVRSAPPEWREEAAKKLMQQGAMLTSTELRDIMRAFPQIHPIYTSVRAIWDSYCEQLPPDHDMRTMVV